MSSDGKFHARRSEALRLVLEAANLTRTMGGQLIVVTEPVYVCIYCTACPENGPQPRLRAELAALGGFAALLESD